VEREGEQNNFYKLHLKRLCFWVINIRALCQFYRRKDLSLAKKKLEKPERVFTKRQLSRWEQQKKRQRIILGLGIFIISAVLVIMGVGWYISQYQPRQQTVIRVNETEFTMKYYLDMFKVYSWNRPASALPYLADEVAKNIERNELMRQGALKLGISVSDDAVAEDLKLYSLPDKDVQRDLVRAKLLISKLLDEHFDHQVPTSAEQVHVMAMLLESEPQASEVRDRLENSDNFTELTAEFSLDYFSKLNQGDYGWHPEEILKEVLPAHIVEYAFNTGADVLSQPLYDEEMSKGVGYWLVKILDRTEEEEEEEEGEVYVQAVLLGSEVEAQEIRERLETGEEFAALAKEFSQLEGVEENEGKYLLSPGMMTPAVEEFALDPELELETISQPIRDETVSTEGAYWLVKVVATEENRQIDEGDRDLLKSEAFDEWIASMWDDPANVVDDSYLDDEKKAWAIEQVTKG